jgi:hypothetical protein
MCHRPILLDICSAFWREISDAMNDSYGIKYFSTWEGVKKSFKPKICIKGFTLAVDETLIS